MNNTFEVNDTVGSVVVRNPALSRVFDDAGIDYCCGGNVTLAEALGEKNLDARTFIASLEESALALAGETVTDAAAMTLTELVDHIEQTHHAYLRDEFPRLDMLTEKVVNAHGDKNERLLRIRQTFLALEAELSSHMMKEEEILFPMIRQMDTGGGPGKDFHCGSISNPIQQMEVEHVQAGSALAELRELADDYVAPEWACNTYRAMLEAFARFERDTHQHIHKENNVLFPRATALENCG